jgi:hypothetical protein
MLHVKSMAGARRPYPVPVTSARLHRPAMRL